jgi:large subunit ribosomal protein L9
MDIILKEDIKGLGYKNDVVTVKPGYGRNYLIPKGFAIIANASNLKMRDENVKQAAHKAEKIKTEAENIAAQLAEVKLSLKAKAGESGKIFGAVTTLQVADALAERGLNIDRKKISFLGEVKSLGEYELEIDLHKEVQVTIPFEVVAD